MFTPFSRAGLNMLLAKKLLALDAVKRNQGIKSLSNFVNFVAALNAEAGLSSAGLQAQQAAWDTRDAWTPVRTTTTWTDS